MATLLGHGSLQQHHLLSTARHAQLSQASSPAPDFCNQQREPLPDQSPAKHSLTGAPDTQVFPGRTLTCRSSNLVILEV